MKCIRIGVMGCGDPLSLGIGHSWISSRIDGTGKYKSGPLLAAVVLVPVVAPSLGNAPGRRGRELGAGHRE